MKKIISQCVICHRYKWGKDDWRKDPPKEYDDISHTVCDSSECHEEYIKKTFEE
jgi:hypothetical protein